MRKRRYQSGERGKHAVKTEIRQVIRSGAE
jgi:hypothetical protein